MLATLRVGDKTVTALYTGYNNKTKITVVENDPDSKYRYKKHEIIRETLEGLVIPYLQTEKGSVIIKY